MSEMPDKIDPPFKIVISSDHMEASLRAMHRCRNLTAAELYDALHHHHVQITAEVEAAVAALCAREQPLRPHEVIPLAHGTPPVHATGPRIEPTIIAQAAGEGRDRSSIPTATEGAVIGRVIPGTPGKEGCDVFGKPLPFREASQEVELGPNVQLSPDKQGVVAVTPGLVRVKRGRLGVETAMEVPGNLDYSIGNVNFSGSVLIRGNVADLFKVIAREDIFVGGSVEAADIRSGNNVEVHLGICCRDKGHIIAANDVRARFICNTTVEAGNDVTVHSEIANSRIIARDKVIVSNGPIYASHISAAGGVTAAVLGSPSNAKTLIECGMDAILRRAAVEKLPEIRLSIARAAKVREVIEPILAQQKSLTASQKERATVMLYDARQLLEAATASLRDIATDFEQFVRRSANADVLVSGTIHPGVTIRFPDMETTFRMPIKGPVRIVCREANGIKSIFAVDEATKVALQLEPSPVHDEVMELLAKAMIEGKKMRDLHPLPTATTTVAAA